MDGWSHIRYREFYDVPRMVVATRGNATFLFCSRFDEASDCHVDHYEVWAMPALTEQQLQGSWVGLNDLALERLPNLGLYDLPFVVPGRGQRA